MDLHVSLIQMKLNFKTLPPFLLAVFIVIDKYMPVLDVSAQGGIGYRVCAIKAAIFTWSYVHFYVSKWDTACGCVMYLCLPSVWICVIWIYPGSCCIRFQLTGLRTGSRLPPRSSLMLYFWLSSAEGRACDEVNFVKGWKESSLGLKNGCIGLTWKKVLPPEPSLFPLCLLLTGFVFVFFPKLFYLEWGQSTVCEHMYAHFLITEEQKR